MGLLNRIEPHDSVREMEAAGIDRYWDGLACALEGRYFGACYLLGYAIEMTLKVAYFKFSRVSESDDLRHELRRALDMARTRGITNLHDLKFWAEALVRTRDDQCRPMDPVVAGALIGYVSDAAQHWKEVLRYRRSIPAMDECHDLLHVADWILGRHPQLWS